MEDREEDGALTVRFLVQNDFLVGLRLGVLGGTGYCGNDSRGGSVVACAFQIVLGNRSVRPMADGKCRENVLTTAM